MTTNSSEHIGNLEDRIARNITAREHVGYMRNFCKVLLEHRKIDLLVCNDALDSLSYIDYGLLDGKQAIVSQRNARQ